MRLNVGEHASPGQVRRALLVDSGGWVQTALTAPFPENGKSRWVFEYAASPQEASHRLRAAPFDAVVVTVSKDQKDTEALTDLCRSFPQVRSVALVRGGLLQRQVKRLGFDTTIARTEFSWARLFAVLEAGFNPGDDPSQGISVKRKYLGDRSDSHGSRLALRELGTIVEEVSLALLDADLRHAQRERLSEVLRFCAARISPNVGRDSGRRETSVCVTAELMHELQLLGSARGGADNAVVQVIGEYPLPWGFSDVDHVIRKVVWVLFFRALAEIRAGGLTVVFSFDLSSEELGISLTSLQTVGKEPIRRGADLAPPHLRPNAELDPAQRRAQAQVAARGGVCSFGGTSTGIPTFDLKVPVSPIPPIHRTGEDVGSLPREIRRPRLERRGGTALVVERSILSARALQHALGVHGIESVSLTHAGGLFELLDNQHFDSLWIDIEDPIFLNPSIGKKLQGLELQGGLVGLSGHSLVAARGIEVGWWDVLLRKPISLRQVGGVIDNVALLKSSLPPSPGALMACRMPSPEEVQIIHGYRRELSRLVL
jgi:hypothetical protein